ncbi:hypothetical protein [Paenibacillus hunanensis]|nr:hypothetical protein [Paenibacillus hunanensis]
MSLHLWLEQVQLRHSGYAPPYLTTKNSMLDKAEGSTAATEDA